MKGRIIDLAEAKRRKEANDSIARGRVPLLISHDGLVSGHIKPDGDFHARMQRIRSSLEKINNLMAELKKNHPVD